MLFKTTVELKEFVPATAAFPFEAIKPYIRDAENYDIIPWLSQAQYDNLNTAYQADPVSPLSTNNKKLLEKIRSALTNAAFLRFIPHWNTQAGAAGFFVSENNNQKIPSQHRIEDLKQAAEKDYYQGMEALLAFLETNIATYTQWAGSSSRTIYKECFVNTETEFSKGFNLRGSRMVFLAVKPIMQSMELDHIEPVLGAALFAAIKAQLVANPSSVSANNKKLFPYITGTVANYTMARALLELPISITGSGVQIVMRKAQGENSIETENVPDTNKSALITAAERDGAKWKKRLSDFIYKNHVNYPLYEADTSAYVPPPGTVNDDTTKSTLMF